MKDLKKFHRVFGHPTEDKLKKLMNDAGIEAGMSTNIRILKYSNLLVSNKYLYSYSFRFKLTNIFKYLLKAMNIS